MDIAKGRLICSRRVSARPFRYSSAKGVVAALSSACSATSSLPRSLSSRASVCASRLANASGSTPANGAGALRKTFAPFGESCNVTARRSVPFFAATIISCFTRVFTRLLAVDWWISIAPANSLTPMPGLDRITLSAHSWAPPMPTSFSTCRKCVLTALNTMRNWRRTRVVGAASGGAGFFRLVRVAVVVFAVGIHA